ncbi:MAG TPA: hypothetical protein VFK13_06030 [Gemmatimonadaceae bacterium]|nr:hypothetical protein [Gemmatimonadaceae bacterium]
MTAPVPSDVEAAPVTAPAPAEAPAEIDFPLGWMLENAAAPLQYRSVTEVVQLPVADAAKFSQLPYAYPPALSLALRQMPDGTWGESMLTLPSGRGDPFQGVGTTHAVRRLREYGWERESPPLVLARRPLFRLLAADEDPAFLFELAGKSGGAGTAKLDIETIRYGRGLLREAAASALARMGYERDPRLRGAATRMLERVDAFLRLPNADKPFVRVGNKHVLPAEAAPPSIYYLDTLAHMPLFRSEHYDAMERLLVYLSQPTPRQEAAVLVGKRIVKEPHLVLGDALPHRTAADADLPWTLAWLELMARLEFLSRNDGWAKLFERLLDDRDALGVWRMPRRTVKMRSSNPYVWALFPLQDEQTGEARFADVTFRLGLIARLSGRPIRAI